MPYREPDPTDPSMRVGVGMGCSEEELRQMACSFAAEMAHMGHDAARIMGLFREPFYAGPNLTWRTLGEKEIRRIVDESIDFWSHCRVVVRDHARGADESDLLWPKPAQASVRRRA